jgi:hypothetical protein
MRALILVSTLFVCGCNQPYEAIYYVPYVTVCSGTRNNWFKEIDTNRLNKRVNDYIRHGYTVSGNLVGTRGEVCQSLERVSTEP